MGRDEDPDPRGRGSGGGVDPGGDRDRGQQRGEQPAAAQHGTAYRPGEAGEAVTGRGHGPDGRSFRSRREPALHRAAAGPALGRQSLVAPAAAGLLSVFGAGLDEELDEPDEESLEDDDAVDVEDPDARLSVR